jgi:putative ATP-dependent endonuclease of OLD family
MLRALVVGMGLLTETGRVLRRSPRYRSVGVSGDYEWHRDFPVGSQRNPDGRTIFEFEFELAEHEMAEFRQEVGSSLNGLLPVELSVGQHEVELAVRKQGRGGAVLSRKRAAIGRFIGSRLDVQYIPSVRTADEAARDVGSLMSRELRLIEQSDEYREAVARIAQLQQPVLDRLAAVVRSTLREFLPDVREVQIAISSEDRYGALRRGYSVIVDDGTKTDLQFKGDGVQSLATVAVARLASSESSGRLSFVLAIEEPEAHLHPRAIHQLRTVLHEIAGAQQVIITTHSPLLVDRQNLANNLIVTGNRVLPARTLSQLRDVLGVRVADNLRSAAVVLVVEGENDRTALAPILTANSPALSEALRTGVLAIEVCSGVDHLSFRLSQLRDGLCRYHVFVDNDRQALAAITKARADGLLETADQTLAISPDRAESEIEDLYDPSVYREAVLNAFNVDIRSQRFRNNQGKWSARMQACFRASGQHWDGAVSAALKAEVAAAVAVTPHNALLVPLRGPVDSLVRALEVKVQLGDA